MAGHIRSLRKKPRGQLYPDRSASLGVDRGAPPGDRRDDPGPAPYPERRRRLPREGAPFGTETRQALDYALGVGERYGLTWRRTWMGTPPTPSGPRPNVAADAPIVGALAHVDVVPAGSGWVHPPFGAEIDNGKIYARGATDDKGPAMAALWALLAVKECAVPLTRRIRLILGANEESGFACVKHYFAHEEMPVTGFTPDAMFPMVYAEKGIANAILTHPAPPEGGPIHIVSLSGGQRPNMVPDTAEAVSEGPRPARRRHRPSERRRRRHDGRHGRRRAARHRQGRLGPRQHAPERRQRRRRAVRRPAAAGPSGRPECGLVQRIHDWAEDTTGACIRDRGPGRRGRAADL